MNMKQWQQDQIASETKKGLPILSFPLIQWMDGNVKDLVRSSDMQAQGMKMIADREPTAASVSLMDLSLEAEAFGSTIRFSDDAVPTVIGAIVEDEDQVDDMEIPAIGAGRTGIYLEAIEKAKQLIQDRPVFAGMIGPYSLAGRLMGVSEAMIYCYEEPDMVHKIMRKTTDYLIQYGKAYKKAGADGIILAEPLTGMLSPGLATEFSHPYVRELITALQDDSFLMIYHNCGNNTPLMAQEIFSLGAGGYHFGDAVHIRDLLKEAPEDVLVGGNVSPVRQFLNGTPESIYENTTELLRENSQYKNFIISSGCDIPPIASWANIDAFFKAVTDFYN